MRVDSSQTAGGLYQEDFARMNRAGQQHLPFSSEIPISPRHPNSGASFMSEFLNVTRPEGPE